MSLHALRVFLFGTLRGRLILSVAAVHAVMMSLFIIDLTARQRAMFLDGQADEAIAASQSLATSAAGWIAADDVSGLQELVDAQRRYPELLFAILADENGRILAHTDKGKRGLHLLDLPQDARETTLSRTQALVDVAAPAMLGNKHVGWARVGIGQKAAATRLAKVALLGVLYALAAIAIGSLIAWRMGLRITKRLYAVQDTIARVRAGDRMARSTVAGMDEAASIAREFNAMLDKLEERDRALRQSESQYRLLLGNINAAVVVHGADTRVRMCNPLAQQLLGLTEEQMMGKAAVDPDWHFFREDGSVMPPEEYPVNLVLTAGPLRDAVFGVHRPGQEEDVWVLAGADPMVDEGGAVTQVIVTFVDITERRIAERALSESEELFRVTIENILDPVFITDDEGSFTFICTNVLHILGYTSREIQAMRNISALFGKPLFAVEELDARGEIHNIECVIASKDGKLHDFLATVKRVSIEDGTVLYVCHDITDRKRAEQEVARLASFPRLNPHPVMEADLNGRVSFANAAARRLFPDLEERGSNHPWLADWESLAAPCRDGKGMRSDREVAAEGRWFHQTMHYVAEERRLRIYGFDITERRQAEEALRESEKKYRTLFEESFDALFITSPCGKILDMNKKGIEIFGYDTKEEVLSLDLKRDIYAYPPDREWILSMVRELGTAEYEVAVKKKNGETMLAHCALSAAKDDMGEIVAYRGILRDITEKRRAEDALRRSEEEKSLLNDIAGVFLTIPDEEMYDEVLAILLRLIDSPFGLFGYIGEDGDLVIPSLSRSIWNECQVPGKCIVFPSATWGESLWGRAIRDKRAYYSDGPFKTPEGHVLVSSFLAVPVVYGQEAIGVISLANKEGGYSGEDRESIERIAAYVSPILKARLQRDREEQSRLKAEEEIRRLNAGLERRVQERTAELENANRELEAFSYSVSHDLRAPLRHISGFVNLLSGHASGDLDEKSLHYMEVISGSAIRMGKLIDDVLSFSRMGRAEIIKTRVSLQDLLTEVLQLVEHDLEGREIEWRIGPLPEVHGSRDMLRIVMSNLISNAIKFTGRKSGTIIEIGHIPDSDEDVVFVKDNGAGFDMQYVDKLFGLFQRLHSVGEFEGTGLGLANVRRIVRRHGGRTWAEGVQGEGATFFFSLPKS